MKSPAVPRMAPWRGKNPSSGVSCSMHPLVNGSKCILPSGSPGLDGLTTDEAGSPGSAQLRPFMRRARRTDARALKQIAASPTMSIWRWSTGRERTLIHMNGRCQSGIGRFLSRIGVQIPYNSQNYKPVRSYVPNNPLSMVDPRGGRKKPFHYLGFGFISSGILGWAICLQ